MQSSPSRYPTVVLLGRTNVGKTTLFSRISGERGLVSAQAHTTRDTKESNISWDNRIFTLIDTGGFDVSSVDPFRTHILDQIHKRISKAACVVLVIEQSDAITSHEEKWIREFRGKRVPIVITINKQDRPAKRKNLIGREYRGIPMIAVSATNGGGVGDLLSEIVSRIASKSSPSETTDFSLGIVGRTNVGKSALFNALLNEDRAIVSPMHHTTRESMKAQVLFSGSTIQIIDTAGAQKHARNEITEASQKLTRHTIATSDVLALVIIAGENPVPSQDITLAHEILKARKNLIFVNNKWDTIQDRTPQTRRKEELRIRRAFRGLDFVPIVMTSATERHRVSDVLRIAAHVNRERFVELQEEDISRIGRSCRRHIHSLSQEGTNPPTFAARYHSSSVPEAIAPIVSKAIRNVYPFAGTPIILTVGKSHHAYGQTPHRRPR